MFPSHLAIAINQVDSLPITVINGEFLFSVAINVPEANSIDCSCDLVVLSIVPNFFSFGIKEIYAFLKLICNKLAGMCAIHIQRVDGLEHLTRKIKPALLLIAFVEKYNFPR